MQGYQPQKNKYMWTDTENDPIPSPPPPTSGSNAVPNLSDKRLSLSLQLEQIAEEFCNNYCKYPDIWDAEKEGMELMDSDICANCPMSRI